MASLLEDHGSVARTREGTRIAFRTVRPDDADAVEAMLLRASDESRYRRFLAPLPRIPATLRRLLTQPDRGDRVGIAALVDDLVVGVAHLGPDGAGDAEIALVVEDAWQGRGIGRALLERITEQARARGFRHVSGTMLRDNEQANGLIDRHATSVANTFEGPYRTFRVDLGGQGPSRVAAAG